MREGEVSEERVTERYSGHFFIIAYTNFRIAIASRQRKLRGQKRKEYVYPTTTKFFLFYTILSVILTSNREKAKNAMLDAQSNGFEHV